MYTAILNDSRIALERITAQYRLVMHMVKHRLRCKLQVLAYDTASLPWVQLFIQYLSDCVIWHEHLKSSACLLYTQRVGDNEFASVRWFTAVDMLHIISARHIYLLLHLPS